MKRRRHLVIPDVQAKPGVPLEHLKWIGEYIAEKRPEVIVQIGDFADMPSLSSYDRGRRAAENRRYQDDITSARLGMDLLTKPFRGIRSYKPKMVLTLGNHEERIERATQDNPALYGKLSIEDLGYEEAGWQVVPFLKPIVIDGIAYAHYFTTGSYGRPVTSARALVKRLHQSATMGHTQLTDIYMGDAKADGTPIIGLLAGSAYLHDEPYLGPQGNLNRRQIWMKHEVSNGAYDIMQVSLEYLKRNYS